MFKESKEFLSTMGQLESSQHILTDRQSFHDEELMGEGELLDSILKHDRVGVADGLADLAYVVSGTGVLLGMNQLIEEEVDYQTMTLAEAIAFLSEFTLGLAYSSNNYPELRVSRIIKVLYRIATLHDIDLDKAFRIAHTSNMSKATVSLEDAKASAEHYGFPTTLTPTETESGTRYVLRSDSNENPKYFKGKVLKPLSWKEPDFTSALLG